MPRKLLIAGATGLLGPHIVGAFRARDWDVFGVSRSSKPVHCDFCDPSQTADLIREIKPDAVVHLVVLSNVDQCEDNPDLADRMNRLSMKHIVDVLPETARLVYISTDQVYGDTPGPHREGEENPVNVYGRTKLAGESAAREHPGSLILRTNLFGPSLTPGRDSLSDFFIRSFRENNPISLFKDSFFSPLHVTTLSDFVERALHQDLAGTYNLGSRSGISKADFALRIADHLGLDPGAATLAESTNIPGRAIRPRDLRMDVSCLEEALGVQMPELEQEIRKL